MSIFVSVYLCICVSVCTCVYVYIVDSYIGALRKINLRNHNTQNNVSLRSLYDRTKDIPSSLCHSARPRSTS